MSKYYATGETIKKSNRACKDFYNAQTQSEKMLRDYAGAATATVIREE